jgi:hypothetical protein
MSPLLSEIETFLATHGMSARQFGINAVHDKHFVKELRAGRRCWPETEQRVRLFIVAYKSEAA